MLETLKRSREVGLQQQCMGATPVHECGWALQTIPLLFLCLSRALRPARLPALCPCKRAETESWQRRWR